MKKGQALVTLLIFMVIAITVTSAAVILILINSQGANKLQQSTSSFSASEAAMENAILRLLRDPNYSGETMQIGEATVTIEISGVNPKIITTKAMQNNFMKETQAEVSINGDLILSAWRQNY